MEKSGSFCHFLAEAPTFLKWIIFTPNLWRFAEKGETGSKQNWWWGITWKKTPNSPKMGHFYPNCAQYLVDFAQNCFKIFFWNFSGLWDTIRRHFKEDIPRWCNCNRIWSQNLVCINLGIHLKDFPKIITDDEALCVNRSVVVNI